MMPTNSSFVPESITHPTLLMADATLAIVSVLNPTPRERLVDAAGRPYFLWDVDMTLAHFEELLGTSDRPTKAYLLGKLMRQAKPDDVFTFATQAEIRDPVDRDLPYLGRTRSLWQWLLAAWEKRSGPERSGEAVVIDLVAEPVPNVEPPQQVAAVGATIQIDSPHEILVNKLGTLLHRAEVRDLVDLQALLQRGGDLVRAMRDAGRKDGGFTPIMLGHLLHGFPLDRQAKIVGLDAATTAALDRFRADLAARIATLAQP